MPVVVVVAVVGGRYKEFQSDGDCVQGRGAAMQEGQKSHQTEGKFDPRGVEGGRGKGRVLR